MQEFSYQYYEHMLKTALKKNFIISSFVKFNIHNPKTIILRHDVDYTMNGVLDFASIEHDLGISATYLFRIHADEYNLFSPINYSALEQLKQMGHEIGLHFETMNIGRSINMDPTVLLTKEKIILETILDEPVFTCSEHRELSGIVHQTPLFHKEHNPYNFGFDFYAMDPKYSKNMKYLSDSNANWREGDLLQHIDYHDRFQILIHPDWWFETDLLLKGKYVHPKGTEYV